MTWVGPINSQKIDGKNWSYGAHRERSLKMDGSQFVHLVFCDVYGGHVEKKTQIRVENYTKKKVMLPPQKICWIRGCKFPVKKT